MSAVRLALIGCGGIATQNYIGALPACPEARITVVCDPDPERRERARRATGATRVTADYREAAAAEEADAVIVAAPNALHAPIVRASLAAGKHTLCEKPLAMNYPEARELAELAEQAGVRHMTAFTYRFVPAMRWLMELTRRGAFGRILHFRSCRLQDWGGRFLGWRQLRRMAGTGEIGDMLSHRVDFARQLAGEFEKLVASARQFVPLRGGAVSELEDWVGVLGAFRSGATGVMESSKTAAGHNESWRSRDYVEINGEEGSAVYFTERWNELCLGKPGGEGLSAESVPREYWLWPGSRRDPEQGNPLLTFRYDQLVEFVQAVREQRDCAATFFDGAAAQAVMDAIVISAEEERWVRLSELDRKGDNPRG